MTKEQPPIELDTKVWPDEADVVVTEHEVTVGVPSETPDAI